MAALLVGCCGMLSSRVSRKHRERREREMEYRQNFETLKEENARRVRQLSDAGVQGYENFAGNATVISTSGPRGSSMESGGSSFHGQQMMETVQEEHVVRTRTPPSYDAVVGNGGHGARAGSR